jgi:hypothetical protein
MAATVIINRQTGTDGAPTKTPITSANTEQVTQDAHYASPGTNPIPVPVSGSNYGFWVSTRLETTVAPAGTINNLRYYMDGTEDSPAGVDWLAQAANVGANSGYRQAVGTVGTTGTELTAANHTGLTGAPVDPFTWTAASPKALAGSTSGVGDFGDFMVTQLKVASTTIHTGAITTETATWQYDET